METGFANRLNEYRQSATETLELGTTVEPDSETAIEASNRAQDMQRLFADERYTDLETQEDIFSIQIEKQTVMRRLHEDLAALDNPDLQDPEPEAGALPVRYDDDRLLVQSPDGKEIPTTLGELVTDAEWDIDYHLDPVSLPRSIRKRYLVEQARHNLQNLLDEQIFLDETGSELTHRRTYDAYVGWMSSRENRSERAGHIVEKMVRLFMKKTAIDNQLGFSIRDADAFQDVVQKIDFIVERTGHVRGVDIEEGVASEGIQFTINQSEYVLSHKRKQIERSVDRIGEDERRLVQDIILVAMPPDISRRLYQTYLEWRQNPSPGGPERMWDDESKKSVFSAILQRMYDQESIDSMWEART